MAPFDLPLKKQKLEQTGLFGLTNEAGDFVYPLTEREADFVCLACNSRDALLEACKGLVRDSECLNLDEPQTMGLCSCIVCNAEAAITQAESQ